MDSNYELHLLANQTRAISPSGSDYPLSTVDKKTSPKLSQLKSWSGHIRSRWLSLCNLGSSLNSAWINDWWLLEILSWLLAALAFGMIILTLALHDDKPIPEWPSGITVNSLISVLSQTGQWGLMGSVAKALGQLKWLWFTRSKRPLMDFVALDEASKGPWGSSLLLIKRRLVSVLTCLCKE